MFKRDDPGFLEHPYANDSHVKGFVGCGVAFSWPSHFENVLLVIIYWHSLSKVTPAPPPHRQNLNTRRTRPPFKPNFISSSKFLTIPDGLKDRPHSIPHPKHNPPQEDKRQQRRQPRKNKGEDSVNDMELPTRVPPSPRNVSRSRHGGSMRDGAVPAEGLLVVWYGVR